ncbi:MAG: hypothetical protein JXA33_00415 [Anaerolineae bacterium]|nr:hypothetical protein [Anaerolineae bacterium]
MGHYPLLFYTGLTGACLLLVIELLPLLHPLRKLITAVGLTAMTLLWLTLPVVERWVFSAWLPVTVLEGQILLDMTPAVWWFGLGLGATFSGTAWIEMVERRESLPLAGTLVVAALPIIWVTLLSGTLLTTLAAWAVFDLLWGVAGLMVGAKGERVTLGLAIQGGASIILWMVSLFLQQEGESMLWWLMWPSASVLILLIVAALMRVGFYPFQIIFPQRILRAPALSLVYLLGPISGLALLYRILLLPGLVEVPAFVPLWGIFSVFWMGLMAWASREQLSVLWAGRALLNVIAVGAMLIGDGRFLLLGATVWVSANALFMLIRGRDVWGIAWSWPGWLAFLFLLGVPPSPLGEVYSVILTSVSWLWRVVFLLGMAVAGAVLLQWLMRPASGRSVLPWSWLQIGFVLGLLFILVGILGSSFWITSDFSQEKSVLQDSVQSYIEYDRYIPYDRHIPYDVQSQVGPLFLWLLGVLGTVALVRWGNVTRKWMQTGLAFLEIFDLQWFYRAIWRGTEHLLGLLRVGAEVFEGSGAVVWSLLVMLLILLVGMNR